MKYNIFIDESGTNKNNKHSTVAFSYVKVLNQKDFDIGFTNAERAIKIDTFHWSENSWIVREKFLDIVVRLDFICKIMISRNPVLPDEQMSKAFKYLIIENEIGGIYIDGAKSKRYISNLKNILRSKGLSTKKIDGVDDNKYPGVRMADLCAGIVRSYMDEKSEKSERLFRKLKNKIEIIFEDPSVY